MPLPSSGNIDLLAIFSEFGVPPGTGLREMVKGGIYVPSDTEASIPTAPPIDMQDFYGAFREPNVAIRQDLCTVSGDGILGGASVIDNTAEFTVTHETLTAEPTPGSSSVTATCLLTVAVEIITATTPTLVLSVGAQNPTDGGFRLPNIAGTTPPPYDDLEDLQFANGPGAEDTVGSYRGSWSIRMPAFSLGISDSDRLSGVLGLPPATDGSVVTFQFTLTHTFDPRIGSQSNFGELLTFDLGADTHTTFRLSLLFLDGGGEIVQDVPIDIGITHKGLLRGYAVTF